MKRLVVVALVLFNFLNEALFALATNRCVGVDSSQIDQKPPESPKWAIVALTKPGKSDISIRNTAIAEKIRPFSHNHDITMIFFSEASFSPAVVSNWEQTFQGVAKVRIVDTSSNGFNSKNRYGYKYMCKFFSLDIYDYLKDYDYYIRCDTDCYLKTLKYDLFSWVPKVNLEYGYLVRKLEAHGPTKQSLPNWVEKYVQKCDIMPTAEMDSPLKNCFNFYNNFHVGRVSFFRRPDVNDFLHAVNDSGRILSHRWGDSTIQAYAVRLFMDPSRIIRIPNMSYVHGSHSNCMVSSIPGIKSTVPQILPDWSYNKNNNN